MVTFTALAKIYSIKYFCNTKVSGLGEILSSENFHVYGMYHVMYCSVILSGLLLYTVTSILLYNVKILLDKILPSLATFVLQKYLVKEIIANAVKVAISSM